MSDVGSGLIKLAYRGIAGFFVILFLFIFASIGVSFTLAGGISVAFCWIPAIFPEILDTVTISVGVPITSANAEIAVLVVLIVGLVLLAVGFFFLAVTYIIAKGAIIVDKEVAQLVDRAFVPSKKDRISRLERLGALHNQGVLTDEEFQQEKNLLLQEPTFYPEPEPSKKFQFVEKE